MAPWIHTYSVIQMKLETTILERQCEVIRNIAKPEVKGSQAWSTVIHALDLWRGGVQNPDTRRIPVPVSGKIRLFKLSELAKKYGTRNFRLSWPLVGCLNAMVDGYLLMEEWRDGHTVHTPPPDNEPSEKESRDFCISYHKEFCWKLQNNGWMVRDLMALDAMNAYPLPDRKNHLSRMHLAR